MTAAAPTLSARDAVIARLREHYAQDHLDTPEFERRVEQAERATSPTELDRVLHGLPALPAEVETALVPAETASGSRAVSVWAALGTVNRQGRWKVPPRVRLRAVMATITVDLSDAELPQKEVVVDCQAWGGTIVLLVDERVAVSSQGSAVLGRFDAVEQPARSRRDARRIRIRGLAVMGRVEVVVRRREGPLQALGARLDAGIRGLLGR